MGQATGRTMGTLGGPPAVGRGSDARVAAGARGVLALLDGVARRLEL
jgi:hypothetical protein